MRRYFIAVFFALLLSFIEGVNAYGSEDNYISWSNLKELKLDGGLNVMFLEKRDVPIISMKLSFKNQGYSSDDIDGIAYMMVKLLNNRLTAKNNVTLSDNIEKDAIVINFDIDQDFLTVYIKSISSKFSDAINYFNELIKNPVISNDSFEEMRRLIIAEIKEVEAIPVYKMEEVMYSFAFKDHPYGKRKFGNIDSIQKIKIENVIHKIKKAFNISDLSIAIAGDVDEKFIKNKLNKAFAGFSKIKHNPNIAKPLLNTSETIVTNFYDIDQSIIGFYANGIRYDDPSFYAATVFNNFFGIGFSFLMEEVRIKRGLAYGVSTRLVEMLYSQLIAGYSETRMPDETIDVIKNTMQNVSVNGVPEDRVSDAKSFVINTFVLSMQDTKSIVDRISMLQMFNLPKNFFAEYLNGIKNVTKKDVDSFAAKYFNPEKFTFVVVGRNSNK